MGAWETIVSLGFILVVAIYGDYEYIRYTDCVEFCTRERESDLELIDSPICQNIRTRVQFERANTLDCTLAETRSFLTVNQCARNKWRREWELARIWRMMTDSYWKVAGLILPICGLLVYWTISHCFTERREQLVFDNQMRQLDRLWSTYEDMAPITSSGHHYALPAPKKRKLSKYDVGESEVLPVRYGINYCS